MRPAKKATKKVSKKPTVGLGLSVPVSVPIAPQELCAQHLSKSPKGKRAIPRALTLHSVSHQCLAQTLLRFWRGLCVSSVH